MALIDTAAMYASCRSLGHGNLLRGTSMATNLSRRLDRAQRELVQRAVGPDQVRLAMVRYEESGELPAHPALRATVTRIVEALAEMDVRSEGALA
jgi:hypothetical protein